MAGNNGASKPVDLAAHVRTLSLKVGALENGLRRLIELRASDINDIRHAFVLTDAHVWVLKTLCQDIVKKDVAMDTDGVEVDLEAYYQAYTIYRKEEEAKLVAEAAERKKEQIQQPLDTNVESFGGEGNDVQS